MDESGLRALAELEAESRSMREQQRLIRLEETRKQGEEERDALVLKLRRKSERGDAVFVIITAAPVVVR